MIARGTGFSGVRRFLKKLMKNQCISVQAKIAYAENVIRDDLG